jgi:hypothetical protein
VPLYAALAWLMARALEAGALGPLRRWTGAALMLLTAAAFATAGPWAAATLAGAPEVALSVLPALLYLAAGAVGAWLLLQGRPSKGLVVGGALALVAHAALAGLLAPALKPLWLSARAARALALAGADPRQGVINGPVTVAGYEEPSIVFLLGTETELGDAADAADAIAQGRPAVVEQRQEGAFQAALAKAGAGARRAGEGAGLDYSNNRHDLLVLYLPASPPARKQP